MFAALVLAFAVACEPAGPTLASQGHRYEAYWLSELGSDSEYRKLLVARMPLG